MERKLDATQEVIVDQEQTIEKFRELVRHLQADILELRERGESQQRGGESRESIGGSVSPVMNLNVQLKSSTIKAHSRVRKTKNNQSAFFLHSIIGCSHHHSLTVSIPSLLLLFTPSFIDCSLIPSQLPDLDFVKSGSGLGTRL